jgi:4a-hydroxytetrahydrobiopterin dehydratase
MGKLIGMHCREGAPALDTGTRKMLAVEVPTWNVVNDKQLEKAYTFKDFAQALAFVNKVGALAEEENHHPDITLGWGKVAITTWTHSAGGLSENDFVLAAKIDALTKA